MALIIDLKSNILTSYVIRVLCMNVLPHSLCKTGKRDIFEYFRYDYLNIAGNDYIKPFP